MVTTIQRWGNSQGLRIPKLFMNAMGLQENDRVEILQEKDTLLIRKAASVPHRTLEERLTAFYGKPVEEIEDVSAGEEMDWGGAAGCEEW